MVGIDDDRICDADPVAIIDHRPKRGDRPGAGGMVAAQAERPARHAGAPGIAVVAGEHERADAGLGQRPRAGNLGSDIEAVGEVRRDGAVVNDLGREDPAGEPPEAEVGACCPRR